MTSVVVFDYGFGNVRSMVRALANLGLDTTLTSDYRQALEADGMVVPGVGAFTACMTGLREVSGDRVILDRLRAYSPRAGRVRGRADHVRARQRARRHHRRTWTDRRHRRSAGCRCRAAHGMGHGRGAVRFRAARRRGERTVLLRALLRGDERHREGSGAPSRSIWAATSISRGARMAVAGSSPPMRAPLSVTQFHPEKSADAGKQLLRNWVGTFSK